MKKDKKEKDYDITKFDNTELKKEQAELEKQLEETAMPKQDRVMIALILKLVTGILAILIIVGFFNFFDRKQEEYDKMLGNSHNTTITDISNDVKEEPNKPSDNYVPPQEETNRVNTEVENQIDELVKGNDTILNIFIVEGLEHSASDNFAPAYKVFDTKYNTYDAIVTEFQNIYIPAVYESTLNVDNKNDSPLYFESDGTLYINKSVDTSWCVPISYEDIIDTRYEVVNQSTGEIEIYITYKNLNGEESETSVIAFLTDKGYRLANYLLYKN